MVRTVRRESCAAQVLLVLLSCLAMAQPAPFDLVFVLDVGKSMAEPAKFIREGARLAAYELTPDDRVALLSYSSSTTKQLDFTGSPEKLRDAFWKASTRSAKNSGPLVLYDSIFAAIQMFPRQADGRRRRFIAVITNDTDRASRHQPGELVRESKERGIAILIVLIKNSQAMAQPGHPRNAYPDVSQAAKELRQLAEETGGDILFKDMNGYVLRQTLAACREKGL